jgi:hypothetical protein
MYDPQQQDGAIIPGDPNKDNTPVHTSPDTTIYTKEYGFAEASIPSILAIKDANMKEAGINRHIQQIKGESARNVAKNVAAPLIAELDQQRDKANENLNKLSDMQHMYREYGLLPDNNGQIYPHAAFGMDAANNIAGITGGLLGLGRYFSAKR